MTFVPNVTPGDPWYPKASTLNSLARSANFAGRSGAGQMPRSFGSNTTIQIYNATNTAFVKGQAVSINNDIFTEVERDIKRAIAFDPNIEQYGICDEDILPNGIGNCVVSGTALVYYQHDLGVVEKKYLRPSANGLYFILSDKGNRVLAFMPNNVAIILLDSQSDDYNYKLTIIKDLDNTWILKAKGFASRHLPDDAVAGIYKVSVLISKTYIIPGLVIGDASINMPGCRSCLIGTVRKMSDGSWHVESQEILSGINFVDKHFIEEDNRISILCKDSMSCFNGICNNFSISDFLLYVSNGEINESKILNKSAYNDFTTDLPSGDTYVCIKNKDVKFLSSSFPTGKNVFCLGVVYTGDNSSSWSIRQFILGSVNFASDNKVAIDDSDTSGFLFDKLKSSDYSVLFSKSNGKIDMKAKGPMVSISQMSPIVVTPVQGGYTIALDEATLWNHMTLNPANGITISGTGNTRTIGYSYTGKVSVSSSDTPGYLGSKLSEGYGVSISTGVGSVSIGLKGISSSSTGILIVRNGVLSVVPIGSGVLVGSDGSLSWISTATCENA